MNLNLPFPERTDATGPPRFDWLQVEVTTYCNAACTYCPHTVYRNSWRNRHLAPETFALLLPALQYTDLVYLQGWGEPLLHPDLFAMAEAARAAGCQLGFTTNGMLLDPDKSVQLVETGFTLVAFSLAGTGQRNDRLRPGTSYKQILTAIERLASEKERRNWCRPAIHIAYMLLKSELEELQKLPSLLSGLGVNEVVISTLDFVPSAALREEVLFPENRKEFARFKALLDATVAEGRKYGLAFHYHLPYRKKKNRFCTENVLRAAFISAEGLVSPCVFTNLPVGPPPTFIAGRKALPYRRLTFGNINQEPLTAIWKNKSYWEFRHAFLSGHPPEACAICPKLYGESV
jgi:MoaA/NifB/PqqE/SkfB family radical SAM enzyme